MTVHESPGNRRAFLAAASGASASALGEPLLLLHQAPMSARQFEAVHALLATELALLAPTRAT